MATAPGSTAGKGSSAEWYRRPVLSRTLRVLIVVVPIAASWGIAIVVSRALPAANSVSTAVLWIAVIAVTSLVTLVLFERGARRLLPLAALLDVSLLFPDRAPARFAVARSSGNPRDLRRRLQQALDEGNEADARWMQKVIELCLALSVHDRATRGHSERVRVYTDLIAAEMAVAEPDRAMLRWAAILHDIGKLEVSPTILNKKGRPSEQEWQAIHLHPAEGARLVAPLLPWLGSWGSAVVQHHERLDGMGYPRGLAGDEVSPAARIVAVADCYEVMTAPRSYKRPMSVSVARRGLVAAAGTQLDPEVVRAFLNVSVGRLWRVIGIGTWLGQIPVLARFAVNVGSWAAPAAVATAATVTVVGFGGIAKVAPPVHLLAVPPLATACPTAVASLTPSASAAVTSPAATLPVITPTPSSAGSATPSATPSASPSHPPSPAPSPAGSRAAVTASANPTPTTLTVVTPTPSATPQPATPTPSASPAPVSAPASASAGPSSPTSSPTAKGCS